MQVTRHEFHRLSVRLANCVRDDISLVQSAMQTLIDDESISIAARDKIALARGYLGTVGQCASQFLTITGAQNNQVVINVQDVISRLTRLFQILLSQHCKLQISIDDDLWPVKSDDERLDGILLSLVANARDAMPRGGTLCIRARNVSKVQYECKPGPTADYVLIDVIDTGVGIPKDALDSIFDPFYSTKGPGCGFTLAHVRSTIKNLAGWISVRSEVGKGTTFSLFLPRHTAEPR